jgi:hypothetical protein
MPLSIRAGEQYSEGAEFSYYGRVVKFREEDSDPGHKERIGAAPETYVGQLVLEIEGVSVEWIGEYGNVRRYTADVYNADGSEKPGRGGRAKWSAMLAPIIAPTDPNAALKAGFRKRGPDGRSWVGAPGLGYDPDAPDFPESLEGHIFYVEMRRIEFGTNRLTGEVITSTIPALVRREDDYVHEGTPTQLSYGGRSAVTPDDEGDETTTAPAAIPTPTEFIAAVVGTRNAVPALFESMEAAGVNVEPYRTVAFNDAKRQMLFDKGLLELKDDQTIAPGLVAPPVTIEKFKEMFA